MAGYKIKCTPEAGKVLSKLDPDTRKRIKWALRQLREEPRLGDDLQGKLYGFKSHKPGRYPVIIYKADQENRCIRVYYVGYRRDTYEQFRTFLRRLKARERTPSGRDFAS